MAFERNRNIVDARLGSTFSLSATTGTGTSSTVIDLGSDVNKPEDVEFELITPAIAAGILVEGATLILKLESSTTSTFVAVDQEFARLTVTASTIGAVTKTVRGRLPANCARYVRGTVVIGGNTTGGTTAAALTATFQPRF